MKKYSNSNHRGIIWVFGLSGAGKTIIAYRLQEFLNRLNYNTVLLDGDICCKTFAKTKSFTMRERLWIDLKIALKARMLCCQNKIVIVTSISPTEKIRKKILKICPKISFLFIDTPLKKCIERDSKGLYSFYKVNKKVLLPGINQLFESSKNKILRIRCLKESQIANSLKKVYNHIIKNKGWDCKLSCIIRK